MGRRQTGRRYDDWQIRILTSGWKRVLSFSGPRAVPKWC